MKLHIGGKETKEGWSILNIQKKDGVDFVGDISDLSQFKNNSIDEIYASHVLEHVSQKKISKTLNGIYKVLKNKGLITDINHIASPWIGMNFLSLDKNTVVVDSLQINLIKLLEKMKFNVIPIKFSNSYFLKGGLHCCTLDTIRKG